VQCGKPRIAPGQIILADYGGVGAIPREVEDVIQLALEKTGRRGQDSPGDQPGKTLREV
jgi:hypothetical protein